MFTLFWSFSFRTAIRGASQTHILLVIILIYLSKRVAAQAPVNDIVSWPSGMLLLATVLYAGVGSSLDHLWAVEPAAGLFIFNGLPLVSIWGMNRAHWDMKACHFISHVRPVAGRQACWAPADRVSPATRNSSLAQAAQVLTCVRYASLQESWITAAWEVQASGLLRPVRRVPVAQRIQAVAERQPTARDYLLFAAIGHHVEWELHTLVYSSQRHNVPLFSTSGSPNGALFDVDGIEVAEIVVAANMARRQFHQSRLRALSTQSGNMLLLDRDSIDRTPVCTIDFHSYAAPKSKVAATLRELAESYYVVIQHIKHARPDAPIDRPLARVNCYGSLWISILGGALLANGRLTIQNLPDIYMTRDARNPQVDADDMYGTMVHGVLEQLQLANLAGEERALDFQAILDRGGVSRVSAAPFLVAGIVCQAIVCYFLSVGTSAGVWTSVAMANALFSGRLSDWHSVWCSRRTGGDVENMQPGLKLRVPGSQAIMAVATFDRTAPAHPALRPGFLVNVASIVAAVLGSIFQRVTRQALGFSAFKPAQTWVLYAAIGISTAVSILLLQIALRQWINEKSWRKMQALPARIVVLSTVPAGLVVSALALYFQLRELWSLWPILDAITFISGLSLGMIENGWIVSMDENMLHLALLNRWVMGAVASSLGRGRGIHVT